MKKSLTLFCLWIIYSSVIGQNVADLEFLEKAMKPGAVLTYDVKQGGKTYQLVASLKKTGDEISFDWKTMEPINKNGSVSMSNLALSKADALFNYFAGGESKLDNETALFISKKIFTEIQNTTQAGIRVNGQSDTATVMSNTIAEFGVMVDGNFLSIPGWELQGGNEIKYTIGVVESQKIPLITRLDIGWTMQLVEIKSK